MTSLTVINLLIKENDVSRLLISISRKMTSLTVTNQYNKENDKSHGY